MASSAHTWDAADYRNHSSVQSTWARELIEKLSLSGNEHILDIGCGDGRVTTELAAHVPDGHVTGIDNSKAMIELAKKSFPRDQYSNLAFEKADASALPFEEEFDVVFSNAALHWVKDHSPVLAGICKSLKAGGRILLQMGGRGNARDIVEVLHALAEKSDWSPYLSGMDFPYGFYGKEEYENWLSQAGLKPVRVELLAKDMIQKGVEGLAGWIRTTWLPYTERIPSGKREQFIADLCAAYLSEHPLDENGDAHVQMVRLEVQAEKPE